MCFHSQEPNVQLAKPMSNNKEPIKGHEVYYTAHMRAGRPPNKRVVTETKYCSSNPKLAALAAVISQYNSSLTSWPADTDRKRH